MIFKMIRRALLRRSIVAAMSLAALAGAANAQEDLAPSPSVGETPAVSPATSPVPAPEQPAAQTISQPEAVTAAPAPAQPKPLVSIYKDLRLGTTRDEVRSKLGKAVIDDKDGMFYQFDNEMVQIRLDKDKKIYLIAVTYTNNLQTAPSYSSIFGVEPVPAADGSVYHMQRYTDAGYWVSYSKAAGQNPTLTVTMQKI